MQSVGNSLVTLQLRLNIALPEPQHSRSVTHAEWLIELWRLAGRQLHTLDLCLWVSDGGGIDVLLPVFQAWQAINASLSATAPTSPLRRLTLFFDRFDAISHRSIDALVDATLGISGGLREWSVCLHWVEVDPTPPAPSMDVSATLSLPQLRAARLDVSRTDLRLRRPKRRSGRWVPFDAALVGSLVRTILRRVPALRTLDVRSRWPLDARWLPATTSGVYHLWDRAAPHGRREGCIRRTGERDVPFPRDDATVTTTTTLVYHGSATAS